MHVEPPEQQAHKNNYSRTLITGYALMLVQIGVSLATVPLALKYLGPEQFGIWVLAVQVSIWLQLLDGGMNGAVARHLIDYQKDPSSLECRSCVTTGFRVLSLQGIAVFGSAILLSLLGSSLFGLSPFDATSFRNILWILGAASSISFSTKILQAWLYAVQRLDVVNCISALIILFEWALLILLLKSGSGLYSLAYARLVMVIISSIAYWTIATRKSGFQTAYLWGGWDTAMFHRLASFGGGMFLLSLGTQLLTMTQTALVATYLGLASATVWTTAPKLFQLVLQMVSKLWDYRIPQLSAMMADGRKATLQIAFIQIFNTTALIGGGLLGVITALNPVFLDLWTGGVIKWSHQNDGLLALGVYASLLIRCVTDFVLHTKKVGWMPALMLAEGLLFVASALFLLPHYGISGMLAASLLAGGILRLPYAWRYLSSYLTLDRTQQIQMLAFAMVGLAYGLSIYGILDVSQKNLTALSPLITFLTQGSIAAGLLIPLLYWLVIKRTSRQIEVSPATHLNP